MTPGRCSRGARAAIFAAVCVLLAATGHIVMSGQGVPGWAMTLAFAGTVSFAWILAGRERGLFAVTAATIAVQGLLHTVFSWTQSPVATDPSMAHADPATSHAAMSHAAMSHAGMGHGGMGHGTAEPPAAHDMTDMAAMAEMSSSSLGMLSAHLLAALLSGLWMAYGERAVFRLLRALPMGLFRPLRLLFTAVVPVPRDVPRVRPVRAGDERAPRRLLLARSVVSRGPPQALAVL
ncbi:hypothetical protein OG357_08280 [Streptomyces sp. NBC_01255]|uniref:hypothetical protein n=1 Tax=Streptomyces sp. NBC_01255 TaxID=2903798 RepID=UPI002E2F4D3F|nr:hypothetical protein [Streptomyces sp. NBC_01255]